jgi:hypothetical protein
MNFFKAIFQYYDISVAANYMLDEPFLYLARKLLNDSHVGLVRVPTLHLPDTVMTHEMTEQSRVEVYAAYALLKLRETNIDQMEKFVSYLTLF